MKKIDDKFLAVFTKYDEPFYTINEPRIGEIKAADLNEIICAPDIIPMSIIEYQVYAITFLLEGVMIVEYNPVREK